MSEEEPDIDELIWEYCEECCSDCPPDEMCPGCECDYFCSDELAEYDPIYAELYYECDEDEGSW
jgi:hypothetical protein